MSQPGEAAGKKKKKQPKKLTTKHIFIIVMVLEEKKEAGGGDRKDCGAGEGRCRKWKVERGKKPGSGRREGGGPLKE